MNRIVRILLSIFCMLAWNRLLADTNSLVYGETVAGSIAMSAQTNYYAFTAASNDVITVLVARTSGTGGPYLLVHDPGGALVAVNALSPAVAYLNGLRLNKTGTYTLLVIESSLTKTYGYQVSLARIAPGVNQRESEDAPEVLVMGQSAGGAINPAGDLDTYSFNASSNDVISVSLVRTNGVGSPYFYIFGPSGSVVAQNALNSSVAYLNGLRLTQSGTYTLLIVEGSLAGSYGYRLNVTQIAPGANQRESEDGPEALGFGQLGGGRINPSGDIDSFTFSAASNDVITVALARTNGVGTPYFYIYDPAGTLLLQNSLSSSLAYVSGLRLTKAGTYTMLVVEGSLVGTYGYQIDVSVMAAGRNQREPEDGAEMLAFGQISGGAVSTAGDIDTYAFNAASNDVITVGLVRTNGTGFPYFYIYDPAGTLVGQIGSANSSAFTNGMRLAQGGTYTLVAIDTSLLGTYGYQISLSKAAAEVNQRELDDSPEALILGKVTGGRISTAGDFDTFAFNAVSNDVITLAILRTNGVGTIYYSLFDPLGNIVATQSQGSPAGLLNGLRLSKTGIYILQIAESTLLGNFSYNICAVKVPGPNVAEPGEGPEMLTGGLTRSAEITAGDLDAYTFSAILGDTVTVAVSNLSSQGSCSVRIYSPSGNLLGSAITSTGVRLRIPCVTNTGDYTVVCRDNLLSAAFAYSVTLTASPGPVPSDDPDKPYLAAFLCTSNVILRWATNAVDFQLQYRTNLNSGNWLNLPPPYPFQQTHFYVTNTSVDPARFYRLIRGQ